MPTKRLPEGTRAFEDAVHGKLAEHLFILEKRGLRQLRGEGPAPDSSAWQRGLVRGRPT